MAPARWRRSRGGSRRRRSRRRRRNSDDDEGEGEEEKEGEEEEEAFWDAGLLCRWAAKARLLASSWVRWACWYQLKTWPFESFS